MRGDMATALRYWSTLHRYTKDSCMLQFAEINVEAAKRTLRDVKEHALPRDKRYPRYMSYANERWYKSRCNR
jgi:hypothetical protein